MRLKTLKLKRAVAVLAATCTLGTCCVAGSIAWAAGEDQNKVNTANIDTKQNNKTSITLHKYEGPETANRSDGTEQTITGKLPVKDVVFTIWRLKKAGNPAEEIDLSTAAGWTKIKDLDKLVETAAEGKKVASDFVNGNNPEFVKYTDEGNGVDKKGGATCKTDATGSCTLPTLPMGLYYVEETDISNAKTCETKQGESTPTCTAVSVKNPVAPFFVTTPLPNPKTTDVTKSWTYNVNVYPKNDVSKNRPQKEVEELNRKDFVPGDDEDHTTITWKISVPISAPKDGKKYEKIGFVDKLTKGLVYEKIKSAQIVTLDEDGKKVAGTTDVELNGDTKYYTVDSTTKTDVVKFTLTDGEGENTGLAKALTAYNAVKKETNKTATLIVELVTKFKAGTTVQDFANVANTFVDDNKTGSGNDTDHPCAPGDKNPPCGDDHNPQDTAYFGTLTVNKFVEQADQGKTHLPLNGAKFKVFEITGTKNKDDIKSVDISESDGNKTYTFKGAKPQTGDAPTIASSAITNGLETKDKTEGQNTLHGTDSIDLFVYKKSEEAKGTTKLYCAVETDAPTGYLLDTTPHCLALKANSATDSATNNKLDVPNKKATGLDKILGALPMTGARGLVILTVCGIVGIAGTLFYIVMKRRKEQEQE
ncbi:SpaH/EbpB family LPXTG-anchored major pilin [Gardnerella greenwoodii]|uniref:Pilus assembly protein n=1 Tax=Gardnerella greenwoodii TaxID=2914925 RepID=A0A2N6RYR2_9BIFI|nr:SpaH/EbpB family LPXTG-anchored major pilin [Gardnerella greenwoodii]MDF0753507.1 SpaH/EbpB family LPXTG-anchored major pilin [Gardnerella greenwoodii]PMC43222.1 pilus assembly protein [Gardnerella greenwoodii]